MKYSRLFSYSSVNDQITLRSAESGINEDELHLNLFDNLRSVFHTHSRRQFGLFNEEAEDKVFAERLMEYHSSGNADQFAEQATQHFISCLQELSTNAGGFIWVVLEQAADDEVLYIFLLDQEENVFISPQIKVSSTYSIAASRLQHALKLNLTEWQQKTEKYLTFLTVKNQLPKTLAWNKAIGFAESVNRAKQTKAFLEVVEQFTEELPPEQEQEYKAKVVEYCLDQEKHGEPVELEALSRHVFEAQPEAFISFMQSQPEAPVAEIHPDRRQLKRYTRISGKDQDISLSFSTLLMGGNIIYDEASDTLTIKALPPSLKNQIKKYLKK